MTDLPPYSAAARGFLTGTHQPFIGGRFAEADGGAPIAVENPSRGEVVAHVQSCGPADIARAVAAARRSFETGWAPCCRVTAPASCSASPTCWRQTPR